MITLELNLDELMALADAVDRVLNTSVTPTFLVILLQRKLRALADAELAAYHASPQAEPVAPLGLGRQPG